MPRARISLLIVSVLLASTALAQDKHEFKGQILTNDMGELCTMCEADMTCTDASGTATTYHFHKRDFWGQMSTVLDYFPLTRSWGLRHSRPVTLKTMDRDIDGKATFDLTTKRIDLPDTKGASTWVDRTTGAWHGADGTVLGTCAAQKI